MTRWHPPKPVLGARDPAYTAFRSMLEHLATAILELLAHFRVEMPNPVAFESPKHQVIIREKPVIVIGADGNPKQREATDAVPERQA